LDRPSDGHADRTRLDVDVARKAPYRLPGIVGACCFTTLVSLGLASAHWRPAAATTTVERSSLWTAPVRRGTLVRRVPTQGTLVPEHVQWLSAATAARVARIVVRPGAQVEPDTIVVVLENAELELAALEAERQAAAAESALIGLDVKTGVDAKAQESSLAGLRADLRDARRHADVADRLAPEGLVGEVDHRDAQNKVAGIEERLRNEEARLQVVVSGRERQLGGQRAELARLRQIAAFRRKQLAALEVRAGIHGVVEDVPLENGQWVAVGTVLAKVAEPDHLKAEVRVAEGDAKDLHRGLSVPFDVPAGGLRGTIERVNPTVVGGSVKVEVTLTGPLPAGARADQTVSGYVEIEKLEDVLFVERPAGAREGAAAGVFRLEPDHVHADRVTVRLGRGSAREIEILGGLDVGDEIIVSDTSSWDTSGRVRLK
jgi:HlyD family secretion protein